MYLYIIDSYVHLYAVQIEAALSQLPRGSGKVSLQTRFDEVRWFSTSEMSTPHTAVGRVFISAPLVLLRQP